MAFNIFALGKMKGRYTLFKQDHPDVIPYLKSLVGKVKEGASIEIKMTEADGSESSDKFTLNKNDVETFRQLRNLKK